MIYRYLVTGGLGFIGSHFIRMILEREKNSNIVNLDKMTYAGNIENLRDVEENYPQRYRFVKGDICDATLVESLMKDVDVVVHFAAETHVDRSISEAGSFVQTDVFGTFVLLNEARKHSLKSFLHISTDEVYGSIEFGSFAEESALNPTNPYSASKAGADRLAFSYYKTFNVPVIISRSSNNFGPFQHPEKLIPLFITNAIENKNLPLYGDGLHKRDWIFVKDNCDALHFLLQKGTPGEVYNVGQGNEHTNMEITRKILRTLEKPESLINHVTDRISHDRRYSLDPSKLKKLGWKPQHSFENALNETIQWYANNHEWWKKTKDGAFKEYYKRHYGEKA